MTVPALPAFCLRS